MTENVRGPGLATGGTALRWVLGIGLIVDGLRRLLTGCPEVVMLRGRRRSSRSGMGRLVGGMELGGGLALLETKPLTVPQLYRIVARGYDPLSRLWRHWLIPDVQSAFDRALRAYVPAGGSVLDLGCGTGANPERLAALGLAFGSYTGVDLSPAMLAVARRKFGGLSNTSFQQIDLLSDPLPEGPFDVIVSTWVFSHLPNPDAIVTRALTRLRPGGHVILLFLADPGNWVSPAEDLILRPFSARAVAKATYQAFPHLTQIETFAGGALALAVLTVPGPGAAPPADHHAGGDARAEEAPQ